MWPRIALAVVSRPALWPAALRQARRLAPNRWWTRRPFLPKPTADYLRFRAVTQHGGDKAKLTAEDVVAYLRWCRVVGG